MYATIENLGKVNGSRQATQNHGRRMLIIDQVYSRNNNGWRTFGYEKKAM